MTISADFFTVQQYELMINNCTCKAFQTISVASPEANVGRIHQSCGTGYIYICLHNLRFLAVEYTGVVKELSAYHCLCYTVICIYN